jgi:hypothetical protein
VRLDQDQEVTSMTDRTAGHSNVAQGETEGPEQEPREVGAADPAVRDPRPDGPMDQDVDRDDDDAFATSPDAAYGQREGQAESGAGGEQAPG